MISSLYIHVPFCRAKCGYCAFYSLPDAAPESMTRYIKRLGADLDAVLPRCGPLTTVYVGGGTPSFLSTPDLAMLLDAVHERFTLAQGNEFTIECNPGSLTREKLDLAHARGVNRISLGIQSFQDRHRQTLGRITPDASIAEAFGLLRSSPVTNVGVDLIYGIPGQTLADWVEDVRTACRHGIRHLSAYALTLEEQSRLTGGMMELPEDELVVEMWDAAAETAAEYGLHRYEVSNLAVPGLECRHNLEIWHGATYVGCGPAAASFDGTVRRTQPADLEAWLRFEPAEEDALPPTDRAAEILAFGLRTVGGWQRREFQARTGIDMFALRGQTIDRLCADGLLHARGNRLAPTQKGLLFADHMAAELL